MGGGGGLDWNIDTQEFCGSDYTTNVKSKSILSEYFILIKYNSFFI